MTESVDEQAEVYIEKTRGRKPTDVEKEKYDEFVEGAAQVATLLQSPQEHSRNLRQALAVYVARSREVKPYMVDTLTGVMTFVAEVMGSMDEEDSEDFIHHVLHVFTQRDRPARA